MNKADLIEYLATKTREAKDLDPIPKTKAARYVQLILDGMKEVLANGEKVTLSDFGTFTVSQRRQFKGHNPKNRSEIIVPSRRIPVFRAGKGLKEALNRS